MAIKKVSVTIFFDIEGVDDDDAITEVLTDMFYQTETLEEIDGARLLWSDINWDIKEIE